MAATAFGLALVLALVSGAVAGVYQWTDASGVVHFTDDPGKVPKKYHDTVREIPPPEKSDQARGTPGPGSESEVERAVPPKSEPASESGPENRPAAPEEIVDLRGHNRDWWQQRVQEWQTRKADAQAKLASAQEQLGRERFLNATTGNMLRIQEISGEISTYEADLREADHMLTDGLPDEARKAGTPPGWLRE